MQLQPSQEAGFILLSVAVKHFIRRVFRALATLHSRELSDRVMFLTEHVLFSIWAVYCVYYLPELEEVNSSWLFNTPLLWVGAESPSPALVIFYLGKVGTHIEDLFVILCSILFPSTGEDTHSDSKMIIHHVATAVLCIGSWCFGYFRIGSVVMLLHDVSDVPLDLVRVCGAVNQKVLQIVSMVLTLLMWGYWRLYFFPFKIVRSVMVESSYSHLDAETDPTGAYFVLTKITYAILLGSLCVLHYLWYWMMLKKCYREVAGDDKKVKNTPANQKKKN